MVQTNVCGIESLNVDLNDKGVRLHRYIIILREMIWYRDNLWVRAKLNYFDL